MPRIRLSARRAAGGAGGSSEGVGFVGWIHGVCGVLVFGKEFGGFG